MLIYPPDVTAYYEKKGITIYSPLKHNPDCNALNETNKFKILYPKNKSTIIIPRGLEGEYQKITVKTTLTKGKLYWFVDENFYAETLDKGELSMDIEKGERTITVMDENGIKDIIYLKIIKNM